ncbi:Mdm20p NDAI_0A06860 [Naumovozyma dairenensis CBS 421]|uniref:Uncharacterized protein n=1 Tax=Naumovozyma dairenensis (strain ATCC 10597 / BCRC 20456 / CBS 421 / NBRC 0211 / NRRL Y-12639) TaxID=1071378 RepID=G0W4V2_NAUDC|nr:hypothetical protein NDAI_0A06860 [Naumovozyma dairenensis CBS 421]CCD22840.1 hypothetical protein NDAI_0A06860 [Naumovozyma dairenensis CBS 421]
MELGRSEEALHVYEKANFKYPSYNLVSQWFAKALEDFNYGRMGTASGQMARFEDVSNLPSREYYFWQALCIVAQFKFQKYTMSEQETKILPQLVYKNLCNIRPFQTNQEIIVFGFVIEEFFFSDKEKVEELINLIIPELSKSVDLYFKNFLVKFLDQLGNYQLLFESCHTILKSIDDFEVIKSLLKAGKELGRTKIELFEIIDSFVGDSRNSRLGRLEGDLIFNDEITEASLFHYTEKLHNKPCFAVDISYYKTKIPDELLKKVMSNFDSDLIHDANVFALSVHDLDSVQYFSKHKETLANKSKTDYSKCSTFILDIVKGRIFGKNPTLNDLVLSLTILENYQQQDPYNFDTCVWLIAIYIYLGLIPLAYSHYENLKIKNVQCDSLDYMIYSRFSSLFPAKQHDLLNKTFEEHNKLYTNSLTNLPQFIKIAFERKSYSKIIGMLQFREQLEHSLVRWMKTCDLAQLRRLSNDKRAQLLKIMHQGWETRKLTGATEWSDNRDWTIFEKNMKSSELPDILSPMNIRNEWVTLNFLKEFMIEAIPSGKQLEHIDTELEKLFSEQTFESVLTENFTSVESWSFKIFYDLYKNDGKELRKLLEEVATTLSDTTAWKMTHYYLIQLSTLKTLDNFKRIKDTKIKQLIKENIQRLRTSSDLKFKNYSSQLSKASENLKKGSNLELLEALGYDPLGASGLHAALLTVQKAVKNL